jgi:chromosome segregation ATPase
MKANTFFVTELSTRAIQSAVLADYQAKLDAISAHKEALVAELENRYQSEIETLNQEFMQLVQARDALRENYVVIGNTPVEGGYQVDVLM